MVTKPLLKFEENGDYFEIEQNDCRCNSTNSCAFYSGYAGSAKPARPGRRVQIGWLGLFLFLLALVSSLYLVWRWHEFQETNRIFRGIYDRELRLVSVFSRHGDRAPSDELPDVDEHRTAIEYFWPNGLHNLTDLGKMRSYKIGLALRHMYDGYFGYDHGQVLAFSSKKMRCIQTIENTLKGFYELEGPKEKGLLIASRWQSSNCTECLPDGLGSPEEWKSIQLDTATIRSLTEREVEQCRFRKEHPSVWDGDLLQHPEIKLLPGIDRLEQVMIQRYGLPGLQGGIATAIYSTITSELNLARTRQTIQYASHYGDWVGEVVATTADGQYNITLYDIFEQAAVYKYRDQTLGVAKWLEIGPMMTSLIDSQTIALGHHPGSGRPEAVGAKVKLYRDKRIIFYSSHDSILQRVLQHLDLIEFNGDLTYEQRFANWKMRGGDEFDKFMSGLSMSFYGFSFKFELWDAKTSIATGGQKTFPYVQLSLYNQEDSRFKEILYKPLKLGDACQRLFTRSYPQASSAGELHRFYDYDLPVHWSFGCPFELFKNVTADLMVEENKFNELC